GRVDDFAEAADDAALAGADLRHAGEQVDEQQDAGGVQEVAHRYCPPCFEVGDADVTAPAAGLGGGDMPLALGWGGLKRKSNSGLLPERTRTSLLAPRRFWPFLRLSRK